MLAMFDIFQKLPDGSPLWVKAVESLQESKRQLEELRSASPGEYFIFNISTGSIIGSQTKAA